MAPSAETLACEVCGTAADPARELVWRKDGHSILRCRVCGLLFRGELPDLDELDEIYGEAYFRAREADTKGEGYPDYLRDNELHRRNARKRLDLLERFVPPGDLLDVGCASGFFLDEARLRGWRGRGVELSAGMAAYAREELGLEVAVVPFQELGLTPDTLDCVTMWDYIEHSTAPADDLRRVHSFLRPGGMLALSTGDAGSLVARLSGRRWHLLTPHQHNFYFSRATLDRLLTQEGFRVRHRAALASTYTVHYLAHKLRTMSGLRMLDRLAAALEGSGIGRVSVPVNLWDIVTVVAEKPGP